MWTDGSAPSLGWNSSKSSRPHAKYRQSESRCLVLVVQAPLLAAIRVSDPVEIPVAWEITAHETPLPIFNVFRFDLNTAYAPTFGPRPRRHQSRQTVK